jgi:uncharacterized repeat protein (TIGR03803 family)
MTVPAIPQEAGPASPDVVKFKTLFNFDFTDGEWPSLSLVQGLDGNLYGTALMGGTGSDSVCNVEPGVAFRLTAGGAETTLYDFGSQPNCADGANPNGFGTLALAPDGNLYGATDGNGAYGGVGGGTVFAMTPAGSLTTLYSFCGNSPGCLDKGVTYGGVVRGADGKFYGAMAYGGPNSNSSYCGLSPDGLSCGAAYEITPQGALTIIYSFCSQANCADGSVPIAQMISGSDGNL